MQLLKGGVERLEIESGLQGKVIFCGRLFEPFELDKRPEGGKQVIGLGGFGAGRTFFQGRVLLDGFMILFDFPPFLVAGLELIAGGGGITTHQGRCCMKATDSRYCWGILLPPLPLESYV